MTTEFDSFIQTVLTENFTARPNPKNEMLKKEAEDLTPELKKAAIEWIEACEWDNLEPEDIPHLSNYEIVRGISRSYSGGWEEFKHDAQYF